MIVSKTLCQLDGEEKKEMTVKTPEPCNKQLYAFKLPLHVANRRHVVVFMIDNTIYRHCNYSFHI
jgi:hypothetical protein